MLALMRFHGYYSTAWAAATVAALCLMAGAASAGVNTAGQTEPACQLPARIRGITLGIKQAQGQPTAEVINRAADYGVNFIMFNFRPDNHKSLKPAPTAQDPLIPYKKSLAVLEKALAACQARGLKAGICVVPWGRSQDFFWQGEKGDQYRDHLPHFWTAFAKKFRDNPTLVAYDLMGEPNFKQGHEATWQDELLPRCVKAVREVNQDVWLIVEPGPWGMTAGFKTLKPIRDDHVMYAFHWYAPHTYTHQGIRGNPRDQTYPGMLKQFPGSPKIMWDKAQLKKFMQPAKDFAQKHHVRMFCGEWGVVRWAPGRGRWASDLISIFEEYGFDWSSFSLDGWNGWNPTFPPDAPGSMDVYGGLNHSPVLDAWKAGWALNKKNKESSSDSE